MRLTLPSVHTVRMPVDPPRGRVLHSIVNAISRVSLSGMVAVRSPIRKEERRFVGYNLVPGDPAAGPGGSGSGS